MVERVVWEKVALVKGPMVELLTFYLGQQFQFGPNGGNKF